MGEVSIIGTDLVSAARAVPCLTSCLPCGDGSLCKCPLLGPRDWQNWPRGPFDCPSIRRTVRQMPENDAADAVAIAEAGDQCLAWTSYRVGRYRAAWNPAFRKLCKGYRGWRCSTPTGCC